MGQLNVGFLSESPGIEGRFTVPRCGRWVGNIHFSKVTKGIFGCCQDHLLERSVEEHAAGNFSEQEQTHARAARTEKKDGPYLFL